MPTIRDVRKLTYNSQRKKNVIPEHAALTNNYNQAIVKRRTQLLIEKDPELTQTLRDQIAELKRAKDEIEEQIFAKALHKLESYIISQPDKVRLRKQMKEKRTITTFNRTSSIEFLFDRYCALRLSEAYNLRTTGRDQNVRILIDALRSTEGSHATKRGIIRFDIRNYYSTIDQANLLSRIESHAGIPSHVEKHVKSVLDAYIRIHGTSIGIPQGVPSSSKLAEIYLERFDDRISRHPAVSIYTRYVDDVVLICENDEREQIDELIREELAKLGLEVNTDKHNLLFHPNDNRTDFDYLGYRFNFSPKSSHLEAIDITPEKSTRYTQAIAKLNIYAKNVSCWAETKPVDLFLAAAEYLYRPHTSAESSDAIRIVSGLAYSARFMMGHHTRQPNFKNILNRTKKSQYQFRAILQRNVNNELTCPCCQKLAHRAVELDEFTNREVSFRTIMRSACLPHLDDKVRQEASGILWN